VNFGRRLNFEQKPFGLIYRLYFLIVCKAVKQFLTLNRPADGRFEAGFDHLSARHAGWGCYL
jgi:hypothetical protein